ncbi:MAG: DUF3108 domain-containing protein [Firmicutes bacterium]|nr:DUF3108 domain-containing protein [Bacillota bacterium]MCM1400497.1 DUF3108 domain-containing protein [Bacteroides sp.]MCM1476875.1 DUF3108 domain-containing protein [Bacteroides sp.]
MKRYIYILTAITLLALTAMQAQAVSLSNEVLNYKVIYKWGLVHKQAGTARLLLNRSGNFYSATAFARSDPWADKIYRLRDTMRTTMRYADFSPIKYEYIAHEDGKYSHDIVTFTHSGNTVTGNCSRTRRPKGQTTATTKKTTLTANGMTVDMLSSFYYLRSLDFENMKPGARKSINIFSGKRKEILTFTYSGTEKLKLNGTTYNTYKVTFTFTSDGRKQSSEPIQAWVSTDARRIPLKLIGKLKIGQVQCLYVK